MKPYKVIWVLILCVFCPGSLYAQQLLYKNYDRSDGLPSDYVFSIYQDTKGYMWFGTERGLARYNGRDITYFSKENGLPDNFIYSLYESTDGCIWIGTQSHLATCYKDGDINHLSFGNETLSVLSSIIEDKYGRIYYKFPNGIAIYHKGETAFYELGQLAYKESNFSILTDGRIFFAKLDSLYTILPTNDLDLVYQPLLCTNCKYNASFIYSNIVGAGHRYFFTEVNRLSEVEIHGDKMAVIISTEVPRIMHIDVIINNSGAIAIVGTRSNGRFIYNNEILSPIITGENSRSQLTTAIFVDYENNLWTSFFGEGIEKITDWSPKVYNKKSGFTDDNIWRLSQWNGSVYTASLSGIHKVENSIVEHLSFIDASSVRGIQFSEDYIYYADIFNVYRIPTSSFLNGKVQKELIIQHEDGINDLLMDDNGILWVAGPGSVIIRYDEKSNEINYISEQSGSITSIEEISKSYNNVWLLTFQEGAVRYDSELNNRHFTTADGLPSNNVKSVFEDEIHIYFATDRGMAIYDKQMEDEIRYVDDLSGQIITGIFPAEGHVPEEMSLWVLTPSHLYQLTGNGLSNPRSMTFLQKSGASINRVIISENGRELLMATTKGLIKYSLINSQFTRVPPKVNLESIAINGNVVPPSLASEFKIRSSSVNLDFEFSGLSFIDENAVRYQQKLSGIDADWSELHPGRNIRYANVPSGTYTFQVRAHNSDETFSIQPATVTFTIDTPLWKTTWARLLYVILFVTVLLFVIRKKIKKINQDIAIKNEQRQFETIQKITATIAHDIKNSVFSLLLLSKNLEKRFEDEDFRKDAIETLENTTNHLNNLMQKLQESKPSWDIVRSKSSISETIQSVVNRLRHETQHNIHIVFEPKPELQWLHDSAAIERILENLIKNAIEAITGTGIIQVRLKKVQGILILEVEDNGSGFSENFYNEKLFKPFQTTKSQGLGLGLFTVKELVKAHNGKLKVKRKPEKGTIFIIEFEEDY